jgi:hydroxymethylglutaryl-CoA synthase
MAPRLKVGIDTLAIYTSRYALDLSTLASARGIDPNKYQAGLGQFTMSVPPPGEDIVTMAANAAQQALQDINVNDIELLLFATESGIDQSKAAGIYVHELLNLPSRCRVVELKQAC